MLQRRLISAAIIIPSIIGLIWLDHWLGKTEQLQRQGVVLLPLMIAAAAMAAAELASMFDNVANRVNQTLIVVTTAVMVTVMGLPVFWKQYPPDCVLGRFGFVFSGLVVAMVVIFFYEMATFDGSGEEPKGEKIDRIGRSGFIFVYLAMFFGFLIPHRYLESNSIGILSMVLVITTVKLSDACAYFAGKQFGNVRLAPKLSPGKTLEGSIGALIGGVIGALVVAYPVANLLFETDFPKPLWWIIVFGLIVTVAGMAGDLAESLIKRDSSTKDSSSWLPGLGGLLDIMDSLIFAVPVSYLMWMI